MNSNEPNETELSEMKIIDLDKLDDNTDINYNEISKLDSLTMESDSDKKEAKDSEDAQKNSFFDHVFKFNWHFIFAVVLVFSIFFIVYRISNWGVRVDLNNLGDNNDADYDIEVVDNILPLIYEGDAPAYNDDVTNVVLFGNDTFAQNRGTSDDMANMIAELSGATVYNCAVSGSYLASTNYSIDPTSDLMDAFNLYWLTTVFTVGNTKPYEYVFNSYSDQISSEAKEAFDTLCSIDFSTIDVIGIMYDANDYLAGKPLTNHENYTDIHYFTGNLEASLDLIQKTYPHIRIIVMSPTYAYAIDEDGDYVSSDIYLYDEYPLSTYALMIERTTTTHGVTFVDNIYGTVNEINADSYLLDNINLNVDGRTKLAERFVYALQYYDEKEE